MQYIFVYLFKKKIIYVNLFLIFPNKHILAKLIFCIGKALKATMAIF